MAAGVAATADGDSGGSSSSTVNTQGFALKIRRRDSFVKVASNSALGAGATRSVIVEPHGTATAGTAATPSGVNRPTIPLPPAASVSVIAVLGEPTISAGK